MNNDYLLKTIVYTILLSGIPMCLYYIATKITIRSRYVDKVKFYLNLIVTCLLLLAFFYTYVLLLNYSIVNWEYLTFSGFKIDPSIYNLNPS